ncbi:hypothetical protein SO802_018527 [Lithocarpus litseifolius]|uniref:Uncharacterized protein n=1 Tax=Lithocarpus litseifolius TaxID=425828 RepID=A0AAW2CNY5_9ROSI
MGIRNDSWFGGGVERFCCGKCTGLAIMNCVEPQFDGSSVVMVCLVVPKMIQLWRRLDLFGSANGWSIGHLVKNAKAGAYKNITIDNWEDIEILCGRDRATSIGVEHMDDAVEVTAEEGENEMNSPIAHHLCQYLLSTSSAAES